MARASDPQLARQVATEIVRKLREARVDEAKRPGGDRRGSQEPHSERGATQGFTAYFAGGCVRDELLRLTPTDYDIATDATPADVKAVCGHVHLVGEAFGVMLVPRNVNGQSIVVEVATFRTDGAYTDKRRPDHVTFADAEADARRRDFTVNALFLDPLDTTSEGERSPMGGRVIDYVGGLADLRAGVIRAVGDPDARLDEDHLRALRAVRFAARLGFTIDDATERAVSAHARELVGVSRERIGEELRRMLAHPSRARAIETVQRLGLDAPCLEEPTSNPALPTLAGLERDADAPTALCAWAIDRHGPGDSIAPELAANVVSTWRSALRLTNVERDALADALAVVHDLPSFHTRSVAGQKRLAHSPGFRAALACAKVRYPHHHRTITEHIGVLAADGIGLWPEPLITGDDLIKAGMKPGKQFKRVLDVVYDAQLEGRVRDGVSAMELARSLGV